MKRLIITIETSLMITDGDADYVTQNPCAVSLNIHGDGRGMFVSIGRNAIDYNVGYIDKGKIIKMAIDNNL